MQLEPVGYVAGSRVLAEDDYWGGSESRIRLVPAYGAEALSGLAEFSHVEVLYLFHQADPARAVTGARHPRNDPRWPSVGIFAQRARNRPNRLGSTVCRLLDVTGTELRVAELDAIDGTPVIDIKPVMQEFLPRGPLRQPAWSHELMSAYWEAGEEQVSR
jgi:tRNA (adenine37-N6)-methyltransferase